MLPTKPWSSTSPSASTTTSEPMNHLTLPIGGSSESFPGFQSTPVAPSYSMGYNPLYGGGFNSFGNAGTGYGGFGYGVGSEQLWGGFLGKTAESLCRLNNLLSMTGMLFDHLSSHSQLLYAKGTEFYANAEGARKWLQEKRFERSEWQWRLGLTVPPPEAVAEVNGRDQENECASFDELIAERNKRRAKTSLVLFLLGFLLVMIVRQRKKSSTFERVFKKLTK